MGTTHDFLRTIVTLSKFLETNVAHASRRLVALRAFCLHARAAIARRILLRASIGIYSARSNPPTRTSASRLCESRTNHRRSLMPARRLPRGRRLMSRAFSEHCCPTMNVSVVLSRMTGRSAATVEAARGRNCRAIIIAR